MASVSATISAFSASADRCRARRRSPAPPAPDRPRPPPADAGAAHAPAVRGRSAWCRRAPRAQAAVARPRSAGPGLGVERQARRREPRADPLRAAPGVRAQSGSGGVSPVSRLGLFRRARPSLARNPSGARRPAPQPGSIVRRARLAPRWYQQSCSRVFLSLPAAHIKPVARPRHRHVEQPVIFLPVGLLQRALSPRRWPRDPIAPATRRDA